MLLATVNVAKAVRLLTSLPVIVAFGVVVIVALTATRGQTRNLAKVMIVGGWSLFAMTTATAQFPTILREIGLGLAGAGVFLHVVVRPPAAFRLEDQAVPWPARFLFIYSGFVLLGCVASPYGPKNLLHWVEGLIIIAAAFYGVTIGLAVPLLVGTCFVSFVNCFLTLFSGPPQESVGVDGVTRLSGYIQPNHLAFAAGVVILGTIWGYRRYPKLRWALLGVAGISAYVLYAARSRTALISLVAAMCISGLAAVRANRRGEILLWTVAGLVAIGPILLPVFVPWFDRGSSSSITTLTGRTNFWPIAVDMIKQRPVVGWGVNVVGSPAGYRFQQVTAEAVQAHNAFLESALISGIPGLLAWFGSFFGTIVGAFRLPKSAPYRTFILGATILLAFFSITESNPAWYGDMFLIVALTEALYCKVRRDLPLPLPAWRTSGRIQAGLPPSRPLLPSGARAAGPAGRRRPARSSGPTPRPAWSPSRLPADLLALTAQHPRWTTRDYVKQLRREGHLVTASTVVTLLNVHGLGTRYQRTARARTSVRA